MSPKQSQANGVRHRFNHKSINANKHNTKLPKDITRSPTTQEHQSEESYEAFGTELFFLSEQVVRLSFTSPIINMRIATLSTGGNAMLLLFLFVASTMAIARGFAPPNAETPSASYFTREVQFPLRSSSGGADNDVFGNFQADLISRWKIFRKGQADGYGIKECLALVLAGEYDAKSTRKELDALIDSSAVVVFTWQNSPSCQQSLTALQDVIQAQNVKIVRLDDPWDKGNLLRAEITKKVKRSSVPAIFIGGQYVGGYDGGVSPESPGIVNLAFQGKLRGMLEDVEALSNA